MSAEEHDTFAQELARQGAKIAGMEDWMKSMSGDMHELRKAFEARQATNWGTVIAGLTFLVMLLAGGWAVVRLQTDSATAALAIELASQRAALLEVETQFRAEDQIQNLHTANNQRFFSLLWQKTFGSPFPEITYYPSVSDSKP